MLVKFLSFAASVIGTARYKAVFLSFVVLLFSLAGIAGVAMRNGSGTPNAASTLEQSEKNEDGTQQGSPQLPANRKQAIQTDDTEEPAQTSQPSSGSTSNTTTTQPNTGNSTKPTAPADITLSVASLSLAKGATSENITATTTQDTTNLAWEIVTDEKLGLSVDRPQATGASATFTVQAREDIDPDRTYQVVVRLKDTAQNTVLTSKTITVTIQ